MDEQASPPELVAEVVVEAVTDGTDRLRCTAGPDAEVLAARVAAGDEAFVAGTRARLRG